MAGFNLKVGMFDNEIYNEIDGKISGEGSEQVELFMFPRDKTDKPEKLHEVIKANDKYAVIKKEKTLYNQNEYYLTGISDEGKYFIHDIPRTIADKTIENILDAVNFNSEGFMRIQGDILLKFVPFEELDIRERATPRYKINVMGFFRKTTTRELIPESLYPDEVCYQPPGVTWRLDLFFRPIYGSDNNIGNHKIIVEAGKILHNAERTRRLVFGKQLTLLHNEHQGVTIDIPLHRVALLSMQQSATKQQNSD